jgi:hypothetical protein
MSTAYNGPDLVYAVTPTATGTLSVTLDASYNAWHLNVRTKCAGNTLSDDIACLWGDYAGNSATNPYTLNLLVAQGTTYYVFANSWDPNFFGPFSLYLSLQ